jgi:hypothetical protein
VRLTNDLGENLRTVFAGKNAIGHWRTNYTICPLSPNPAIALL